MRILHSGDEEFAAFLAPEGADAATVPADVMEQALVIFDDVTSRGDTALFEWTARLERHSVGTENVAVSSSEMERAKKATPGPDLKVMRAAAKRIKAFHKLQMPKGMRYDDGKGTVIEERIIPVEKVGVCIPGGTAPLASSVLMTAIPAKLAGVKEIHMISPWPEGEMSPHVLTAAKVAGVNQIFKVGGVQGVAALANGTDSIPKVDKIVGPGSIWVTAGKAIAVSRGLAGIESLAGPSEVVVVADASSDPELVALDLVSQAEHGGDSMAVLVSTSRILAEKVEAALEEVYKKLGLGEDAALETGNRVVALVVKSVEEAARVSNEIAPEHLEIMVKSPGNFVKKITNAASVFVGPMSPVPAGDYMAGGNHVLPTGRTARFASPLGVQDFVKRQTVTKLSRDALQSIYKPAARFAEFEGLEAHALSVKKRFGK